jgi:hypothetical protein
MAPHLAQLRRLAWSCSLVLLVWLLIGCQESDQAQSTGPPTSTPTVAAATPTRLPTATVTAAPTLTNTPQPSATPDPVNILPDNWREFGNYRLGLQIGAPQTWQDATWRLRENQAFEQFGQQMIFLVDSQLTAERLLSGTGVGEGAFVFGYVLHEEQDSEYSPLDDLNSLLDEVIGDDEERPQPITAEPNGLPAAYVDLRQPPIDLFATLQPLHYRLLCVSQPGTAQMARFLIGVPEEALEAYQGLLATIVQTVAMPASNSNQQGHLISDDLVNGLLENGRTDIWTFNGGEGRYATVTLTPNETGIDLTLSLIDPAGNILVSVDNGYAGDKEAITDIQLTEVGTYIIEVSEFFDEPGRYRLTLLLSDEPQFGGGGRIEFGQQVESELLEDGEHTWLFNGTAGQSVTIILSSLDEQLDVILELRGPDGRQLAILDEGFTGDAEVLSGFDLSVTGEYLIRIRGFGGHGGRYTLSLDEGGERTANFYDAGDIAYGEVKRETLRADEAHAWFFTGQSGDNVIIEVTPLETNMDLDLWLLDPELNELVMQDEFVSGQPEQIDYELPADGQYLILVREFFGEPGAYEIVVNIRGDNVLEIAGPISYGQTVSGVLLPGRRAGWTFTGRSGDTIDIVLRPTSTDRDLVLVLIDPDGNVAITVDAALSGLPERLVAYTLSGDGLWTIAVQEFFSEGGDYELTLSRQS